MNNNGSFTAATEEYIISKIKQAKYCIAFIGQDLVLTLLKK